MEYYEQSLYGREWLLAYKQQPSSGVTLRRCHYSPTMDTGPLAGHLDQPPSVVSDSPEVEGILLPLPDSTDNYLWRCPSAYVTAFSEYTVLDQTGTPVAKFRMTDGGSCSSPHVMP
ncbi:MAG: hypothetical protein FWE39_02370 [Nocardiaceae bacterium]|nr:hypothetical protein [Nocardiaceae bacterium]